jgi:ATP-dependent Zn protease
MAESAPRPTAVPVSDEEMAYHEAGHAVIHLLNGGTISRVSIDRQDPQRGVHPAGALPEVKDEGAARARAAVAVAGEAAGLIRNEQRLRATAAADYEAAMRAARRVTPDEAAAQRLVVEEAVRVRERLGQPEVWRQVEAVAAALMRQRTITGEEVARAIRGA